MNTYKWVSSIRPIELAQAVKWLLRVKRVETTSHGLIFDVDPISNFGGRLLSQGDYEPSFTQGLLQLLQPGQTFVDVGANEGWYSVIAARAVGETGSVIAVEPQERCWSAIHRNFALNDLLNYRVVPCALGSADEKMELFLYPSINAEATTLIANKRWKHFTRQQTRVLTLTSLCEKIALRHIDLLKIDCEGYELEVLKGAQRLFAENRIQQIVIEFHPALLAQQGTSEVEIGEYVQSFGFERVQVQGFNLWKKV